MQSRIRHLFSTVPATSFFAWAQPVFACHDSVVAACDDTVHDHIDLNVFRDLLRTHTLDDSRGPFDVAALAGNYLILRGEHSYALYAHLKRGSLQVSAGQSVVAGTAIAQVGNSGNSMIPHLHFQLMDGPDPFAASGVMCLFSSYERRIGQVWEVVRAAAPEVDEIVRNHT